MGMLDDPTASQPFAPPSSGVGGTGGGMLNDPTAGQAFGQPLESPEPPDNFNGDMHNVLSHAVNGIMAQAHSIMSNTVSNPDVADYNHYKAQSYRANQAQNLEDMTPQGRRLLESGITSPEFWRHPVQAGLMQGAEMAIGNAPWMAAAAIGTAIGGPAGGVAGSMLGGGVTFASQASDQLNAALDNADPEALKTTNPHFAALVNSGVSIPDAKRQVAEQIINDEHLLAKSFAIGMGMGVAGAEISGIVGPAEQGALRAALGGAGRGYAEQAIPTGLQSALTQHATAQAGVTDEPTLGGVVQESLGPGIFGAVTGGVPGLFRRRPPPPKRDTAPLSTVGSAALPVKPEGADEGQKETVSGEVAPGVEGELSVKGVGDEGRVPSEQGQDSTQSGGEAKNPRSRRTYPKKGAEPTGVTPSAGEVKETGPAPPSHPVGDDQKAALDAAINPSTIDSSKPPTTDVQSRVGEPQREVATAQDQQGSPPTGIEPAPLPHPQTGPENAPRLALPRQSALKRRPYPKPRRR